MEFDAAVVRLEQLVADLEQEGDERALELLQLVDAVHRPALARLAAGEAEHPLARALLAMYGLAPLDARAQVEEALDAVRPYVRSHGGEVELLSVDGGVVHVRMSGACHGCAGSAITLRRGVEEALRAGYPGFERVVAHEPETPPAPLLAIADLRRPVFSHAGPRPGPSAMAAATVNEVPVLLVDVENEVFAFRNACAVDGLPLEGGRLTGSVLVCPWHNCAYDARTGERLDEQGGPGLSAVPIAVQGRDVHVAVNVL